MSNEELTVFKSKVMNMLVQYLTGIMKNNISDAEHFIKEQPKEYALSIINEMNKKNCKKMFDELNISDININKTTDNNNEYIYDVSVTLKYLDYVLDSNFNVVSGTDNRRIEKKINLKVVKKKNVTEADVYRCPGCGHSVNINESGKCQHCGAIFNLEDYDYQILEIEKVL